MSALSDEVEEVRSAAMSKASGYDRAWSRYERWCLAQGLTPLRDEDADPGPEECLLMFLEAYSDERSPSYGTLRAEVDAVVSAYERAGRRNPKGADTKTYLAGARRRLGARRARPMDAFTWRQVQALAEARAGTGPATANLASATQAVAYLLLGVTTGHRHAELQRLTLGMLEETATGFSYTLRVHKGNLISSTRGGSQRQWRVEVAHAQRGGECVSYCVACALDRQLSQRHKEGAGPNDLLFVADDRRSPFLLSTASQAVKRAWAATRNVRDHGEGTLGAADAKLGTRSLRVTAATLAIESGMSLGETAELLHHRRLSTTQLYVRRLDERSLEEFTLPL